MRLCGTAKAVPFPLVIMAGIRNALQKQKGRLAPPLKA
jgi:hypothetical protein